MDSFKLFLFITLTFLIMISCGPKSNTPQKPKVALVMKAVSNPFFARMEDGAQRAADSLGVNLLVGTITKETDIEQQISLIENMIVQTVKAIVNVLKKASDSGIRIINIDNRIDAATAAAAGLRIDCYIGVDNKEGGWKAGEYLVRVMGGKGQAAMLEGIRGVDNAEARKIGFLKALQ